MSDLQLYRLPRERAQTMARQMLRDGGLRPDMANGFAAEGRVLPEGPVWALVDDLRVIGLGGLEPQGAASSLGWLLVADGLSLKDWAAGRQAMAEVVIWARGRGIRRIEAVTPGGAEGARRLLERLGFEAAGPDDEGDMEMVMHLEAGR